MSINSTLKAALNPIAPAEADVYGGDAAVYIAFGYNSLGADFGDDAPSHERFLVQVHLYAPNSYNTINKRREIKKALAEAGATWPIYENASDKDGQHHVFECELIEAVGVE